MAYLREKPVQFQSLELHIKVVAESATFKFGPVVINESWDFIEINAVSFQIAVTESVFAVDKDFLFKLDYLENSLRVRNYHREKAGLISHPTLT